MPVIEPVPNDGIEIVVTLHSDLTVPTYPKTELTGLLEAAYRYHKTSELKAALGISGLDVHGLRNGSYRCNLEEVKRLLKEGLGYEQDST